MGLIESEIEKYIQNIDNPDNSVDALVTGGGYFDLAVLATDNDLYRPKVKIVDFDYPEWDERARKIAPILQSDMPDWTYEFEGDKRDYSNSQSDPEYTGQIYLADSVNESRLNEFSEALLGGSDVWKYLDEIHELE